MSIADTQAISLKYNVDLLGWTLHHLPEHLKFSMFDRWKPDLREYMDTLDDEREISDAFGQWDDLSSKGSVEILLPIETLIHIVENLPRDSKFLLWEMLDEDLADYEDYLLATDLELQKEIEEATASVERGEYVTLEDLLAEQKQKDVNVSDPDLQ